MNWLSRAVYEARDASRNLAVTGAPAALSWRIRSTSGERMKSVSVSLPGPRNVPGASSEDVINGGGRYYYRRVREALRNDGDIFAAIDEMAKQVSVGGVLSDLPATTACNANGTGLE